MWDGKKLTGTIVIGIGLFILCGGITCWVIGTKLPIFYTSKNLISFPVYPKTENKYGYWEVASNNTDNIKQTNLTFQLDEFFLDYSFSGFEFNFIHNFFGYDISAQLYDNQNRNICSFNGKLNEIIGGKINTSLSYVKMTSFPDNMPINRYYRVHCPYPTLITDKNNITEGCKRKSGSFMRIPGEFMKTELCTADLSEAEFPLTLRVNHFNIVTKDFIHTPQLYLAAWEKTESIPLTISGSVVTSFGMAFVIAALIIFFSMMFDQQG